MSGEMFLLLAPIGVPILMLAAFLAFLLIHIPNRYRLKFIGIPVLLISAYLAYTAYDTMLGRPIPMLPAADFALQGYRLSPDGRIEIWGVNPNTGKSRLYVIPNDNKTQRELAKAEARRKKTGIPQIGHIKRKGKIPGNPQGKYDIEFYDFPFNTVNPKKPLNLPPETTMPPEPPIHGGPTGPAASHPM